MSISLKIGTRGSALALYQAQLVKTLLQTQDPSAEIEIIPIDSDGDHDKTTPLRELGGKGVFIKAIESALMAHDVDIAVHSLKDVTTELAPGSELVAFLPAESASDTLCLPPRLEMVKSLRDIPPNATIATGSLRRHAQLQYHRPDLSIVPIRGNVDTRLGYLDDGQVDAVMLSEAGLIRLQCQQDHYLVLSPTEFIPAPGQGVIAIQARSHDPSLPLIHAINHHQQAEHSQLELAIVRQLGFDCQYPLGLYAQYQGDHFSLSAFNADPITLNGRYIEVKIPVDYSATDLDEVIVELIT